MDYKKQLDAAVSYAAETGSYSKLKLAESMDIVCAYGAGRYFKEAFSQWDFKNKMHINLLCDSDENKWGGVYEGLKCVSPDELFSLSSKKSIIVITFIGNPVEINQKLKSHGIPFFCASDCIFEMICNMERSREWFSRNNMSEVFEWLHDDESKRIYTNVICNRIAPSLAEFDFDGLYSEGEYFDTDVFKLDDHECYVDCGAYIGDTVERMLDCTNGRASCIYAFEMDKENYVQLQTNVERLREQYGLSPDLFHLYNAGVWNENGRQPYGKELCGTQESFCLFKTEVVDYAELVKMDDLLQGNRISFIKLDIEGAECNALKGARNIIQKNKPKIAVCLYHRLQDFWEIPSILKQMVPEYRFYVRHHQNGTFGGTVLYAVL